MGEVQIVVKSRPEPQHARPAPGPFSVLTHDPHPHPVRGQTSTLCGLTCQKGSRQFDLGKGKACPWDTNQGSEHTGPLLESGQEWLEVSGGRL